MAAAASANAGVDRLGNLRLEQVVQRRLVLGLQALERDVVLGQKPHGGRIEQRRRRARDT